MSFNLSLVSTPPQGEVKTSVDLPSKVNPDTGAVEKDTVTEGGITIDKAKAPQLVLDGPLGHMYTELLNRELSLESMGAVVAAAKDSEEEIEQAPGKVAMTPTGPIREQADPSAGYIFVTDGDTLKPSDRNDISVQLLKQRREHPDMPVGLAMLSSGNPSPTLESLTRCMEAAGVRITYLKSGLTSMARSMVKGN